MHLTQELNTFWQRFSLKDDVGRQFCPVCHAGEHDGEPWLFMTGRRDGDGLLPLDVERTVVRIVKDERRPVGVANQS